MRQQSHLYPGEDVLTKDPLKALVDKDMLALQASNYDVKKIKASGKIYPLRCHTIPTTKLWQFTRQLH